MQTDRMQEIDPSAPLTEQASGWWMLLNESHATDADRHAFAEWVTRSPERVGAYLRAAQVARALSVPRAYWPDTSVEELVRMAAVSGVAKLPAAVVDERTTPRSSRFAATMGVAAVLASVIVAIVLYFVYPRAERFETALGEQHSVVLSDGSLVTLNTTSSMEVHFGKTQRRIALLAGEALFQVAHDVTRPFEVMVGEVTVRAVGTRFNVDRHSQVLRVTVVEGRVEVSSGTERTLLGAGEQLTLTSGTASRVSGANVAAATAWTQRQLVFENRPLGAVVAELNRYNRKIIDIQSAELRSEPITGVFQANDPASFLVFLERIPGTTVEESADGSRYVVRMSSRQ